MTENNRIRLKTYLTVFIFLLSAGIAGFMLIERFSLMDAIYFSLVNMATVGYGDIHPQSDMGKLLALILIVGGVGTFLGVIASITDLFVNRREEAFRRQKRHMVTGLFSSEMGSELLKRLSRLDPETAPLEGLLNVSPKRQDNDFDRAQRAMQQRLVIDLRSCDLGALREGLVEKGDLLLRLIENPVIQEDGNFTDLLRAVFHLRDELLNRSDLAGLSVSDRTHLENDMVRIYGLLIVEWLNYMRYLKKRYGYLFSLAMRTNPFDPAADVVVRK